ncbi:DNA replication/repair protein RecF [Syntrophomonas erecta]
MKLQLLQVYNFRNIKALEIKPSPALNVIIGDNAQGKTNLLEAIYVIATGSSFRSPGDNPLVNYEADNYQLKSRHIYQERQIDTLVTYQEKGGKNYKINGRKTNRSHTDRLRVVMFTPDDLYLIKGSPSRRRNFLDFILKQISVDYDYYLNNYFKILKKRNYLLKKENKDPHTLKVINDIFVEYAARVIMARINLVTMLDGMINGIHAGLSGSPSELKLRYALSFPIDNGKINLDVIHQALKKQMELKKSNEEIRRRSLVGPHLDDLHIYQNNRLARLYSSQGQQRNVVVTLKLAEINTIYEINRFYPVLLLDEVLAELDEEKKNFLFKYMQEVSFQTFLTSTQPWKNHADAVVYVVENGIITGKE